MLTQSIFALKLFEARDVFYMLHNSVRADLPAFWVRPQPSGMGTPQCRNLYGVPVPDERAYLKEESTGVRVQLTEACEDVHLSEELGIAIFTCDPGRPAWNAVLGPAREPHWRGGLWILDYKTAPFEQEPTLLNVEDLPDHHDFHPLGITIYEVSPKLARLFVVNHRGIANVLEVIDLQKDAGVWRARYVRTIAHPLGTHASNSVEALDRNEVVVTNMHTGMERQVAQPYLERTLQGLYGVWSKRLAPYFYGKKFKNQVQFVEDLFGGGWIAHIKFEDRVPMPHDEDLDAWEKGVEAHVIARGIPFANGLSLTPGHRHLVAASTTVTGVVIFPIERWTDDGTPDWADPKVLGRRTVVPTPFFADNVEVIAPKPGSRVRADDPLQGAKILVAGHPSLPDLHDMLAHLGEGAPNEHRAPSWAVEISYTGTQQEDQAPLPAHERITGVPHGWTVRTLFQTDGKRNLIDGKTMELPTSCGVAWDSSGEGHGTLIVTGLYSAAPMLCRGVYV